MKFNEAFTSLRDRFITKDVSNIPDVVFEFNIKDLGTFYAKVEGGKLSIEPYNYYDNDASLTATYDNFVKIIEGKLNPVNAFLTGRLKVDGDLGKAAILEQILK